MKPTSVLDEKDVVTMKELSSGAGQAVGIQATDAQDAWKAWIERYIGALQLWAEEQKVAVKNMLWDIHGLPTSSGEVGNEQPGALSGDERPSGFESSS